MKKFTYLLVVFFALAFSWQGTAQFTEDFEGGVFPPTNWTVINDGDPNGWQTGNGNGAANSGTAAAEINYGSVAHDDWLITPQITVTSGVSDRIGFFAKNRSTTFVEEFNVMLSTTGTNKADFTVMLAGPVGPPLAWTNYTYSLSAYVGQSVYIAIQAISTDEFGLYIDDVVNDANPSCIAPSNLTESNKTPTQVDLSWTAGGTETAWNLEWGLEGFTQGTGTLYSGVANPFTLTGLTADTSYDYYVQSDCGVTGTSTWTGPYTFFTGYCISVPTSNDANGISNVQIQTTDFPTGDVTYFDHTGTIVDIAQNTTANLQVTFETGYTYDTNVWIDFNDNLVFEASEQVFDGVSLADNPTILDASFPVDAAAVLGNHRMRMGTADSGQATPNPCYNGSYGVTLDFMVNIIAPPSCLPPLNLTVTNVNSAAGTADLSWTDANAPSNDFTYSVEDVTNGVNFIPNTSSAGLTTVGITGLVSGNDYTFSVFSNCGLGGGDSTATGPFAWNQTDLPSCVAYVYPPDGATGVLGGVTPLFWTENNPLDADSYDIYFGQTSGALTNIGNIASAGVAGADMGVNITGTLSNTTYYWTIVPVNAGGNALACVEFSFTTDDAPTAPVGVTCNVEDPFNAFTEEFDTQGLWTGDIGTANGVWHFGQSGATGSSNTGPSAAHSGTNYMYFEASSQDNSVASADSPAIDLTAASEGAELSFFMHAYGAGMGRLDILVSTDGGTTYNYEDSWGGELQTASTDAWIPVGVNLDAYLGQTINIRLEYLSTSAFTGDMSIDLFEVNTCQTIACPQPLNLAVANILGNSADVSWTDAGTSSDFEYELVDITAGGSPTGAGTLTGGPASVSLTGLTAQNNYDVYVRANCGLGTNSLWTGPVSFTTPCATFVPDYLEDFTTFVPNCWDEGEGPVTGPTTTGTAGWTADGFANAGSTGAAKFNLYNTGDEDWLLTPTFDLSAGGYEINFDVAVTEWGNTNPSAMGSDDQVLLMQSLDGGTTWTTLITYDAANTPSNTGDNVTVDISAETSAMAMFAFWANEGAIDDTEDYDFFIDNFAVRTPPTCFAPTNLIVSDINPANVDLSWDAAIPAPGDGYYWEIQPQGNAPGDIGMISSGSTVAGITSVIDATGPFTIGNTYTLYVNSICALGTDESIFTSVDFTIPYNGNCGVNSSAPNVAIPDNDSMGVTDTMLAIGNPGEYLTDLNVYIGITHTYTGDLTITLTSPSGTSVELFNTCGTEENLDVEFDDGQPVLVCGVPGVYAPANPLAAFNGEIFLGNWTLTVVDVAGGDTGTLDQWCLIPTFTATSANCTGTDKIWENTGLGFAWTGGAPSPIDRAFVTGDYDTFIDGVIDACELWIDSAVNVNVADGSYIIVQNDIANQGNLTVANNGSIVQVNDNAATLNGGSILVGKLTSTSYPGVAGFSVLGSPMTGSNRATYEGDANVTWVRNHVTANFVPHPDVEIVFPGVDNWADDNGDNWVELAAGAAVNPGEGYLVGGPDVAGSAILTEYTQGTLNNGVITFTPSMNATQNDSPNILSNPYASGLDIGLFLGANGDAGGAVYFWEHLTPPDPLTPGYNPNMNYDMGDISMHNGLTGTAAANGGAAPGNIIPSGQGFGIKPTIATPITFNNSMRSLSNTNYRVVEKDELHLSIKNESYNLSGNTAIGFTSFTDDAIDSYDVKRLGTFLSLYTMAEGMEMGIQMRSTFNLDQVIPLAFSTLVEEVQDYTISIREVTGELIEQTDVYLKDNVLGTLTNLSETDYTFSANVGDQQGRFVIVFVDRQLGTDDANLAAISVYPNPTKNLLTVISPVSKVNNVVIHDIAGRTVAVYDFTNKLDVTMDLTSFNSAVYFVEINTEDGSITKRVVRE